jgi:hypothetical protein
MAPTQREASTKFDAQIEIGRENVARSFFSLVRMVGCRAACQNTADVFSCAEHVGPSARQLRARFIGIGLYEHQWVTNRSICFSLRFHVDFSKKKRQRHEKTCLSIHSFNAAVMSPCLCFCLRE